MLCVISGIDSYLTSHMAQIKMDVHSFCSSTVIYVNGKRLHYLAHRLVMASSRSHVDWRCQIPIYPYETV